MSKNKMEILDEWFDYIKLVIKQNPKEQHRITVEPYVKDVSLDDITISQVRTGWIKYEFFIFDKSLVGDVIDTR